MPTSTPEPAARQGAATNPLTHFVLLPVFLINFGVAIDLAAHAHDHKLLYVWLVIVAFALLLLNFNQRIYALRVQDRVIRLEERLRISALVSPEAAYRLATPQLIALRFASDAELPALVHRTLTENLDLRTIKDSIITWRYDDARV